MITAHHWDIAPVTSIGVYAGVECKVYQGTCRNCGRETTFPVHIEDWRKQQLQQIPACTGEDRKQARVCATAAKLGHCHTETDNRADQVVAQPAVGGIDSDKMAQTFPAKGGNTK